MKKSILEYTAIAILFSMVIYQSVINRRVNNEVLTLENKRISSIYRYCDAIYFRCFIESSNIDTSIVLKNSQLDIFNLSDILTNQLTLVLYTTDNDCNSCLIHAIGELSQFNDADSIFNICIIANVKNIREFQFLLSSHSIKFPSYFTDEPLFQIKELSEKPFYFSINRNLTPSHFFVPEKTLPEYTKYYLHTILNQDNER